MRTQYTKWYLISLAVMFGLPWAAVTFAPSDAGMAICFEDYRDGTLKELYYSRYGGKSLHEQSHGESFLAYF